MRRAALVVALLLFLAGPVLAGGNPVPGRIGKGLWTMQLGSGESADSTVHYFHKDSTNVSTTVDSLRAETLHWSILNSSTAFVTVRLYGFWAPNSDGTMSFAYGDDYAEVPLDPGEALSMDVTRMTLTGVSVVTAITSGEVKCVGWNP